MGAAPRDPAAIGRGGRLGRPVAAGRQGRSGNLAPEPGTASAANLTGRLDSAMLLPMNFDLASFDVATFDPIRPARRRPAGAVAAKPAPIPEPKPAPLPVADPEEVARLGEAVASLARQLGEAQAANGVLAERLHVLEAPRREAEVMQRLKYIYSSRLRSPI